MDIQAPPISTSIPVKEPDGTPVPVGQSPAPAAPADPLDSAVDSALGAAPKTEPQTADPLDAAVDDVVHADQRQKEQLNQLSAYRASHSSTPPEKQLEVMKYAIVAGIDPAAVEGNLDELKKTVDTSQLAARLQSSPGLAKFMTDAAKAPLVKDDAANLSALEWALTGKWEHGHLVTGPATLHAFRDALYQQRYIYLAERDADGKLSPDDRKELDDLEAKYGAEKDYGEHWWSRPVIGLAKMVPYIAGAGASSVLGATAGAFAGGLSGAGAGAAAGAPAAGVGAAPGAVAGGATGAVAGTGAGALVGLGAWNYYQNYGPQYRALRRLKDEDGNPLLSEGEARIGAGLASAVSAGLMGIPMGSVLGKLPGFSSVMGKIGGDAISKALTQQTVKRVLLTAPLKLGANAAAGGVAMAAMAAANSGSEELAKAVKGQEGSFGAVSSSAAHAFVSGIQDMALLSATGAGRELLHDIGQAKLLEQHTLQFQAEAAAAEQSKLLERSPEHFEEMHRLAQGENAQKRFISVDRWNEYWQSKGLNPGDVASKVMGDEGKGYAAAATSGGDLAIPAEKFLSNFGKTEHLPALAEDIRFSQDGVSPREAKARFERLKAEADKAKMEDDGADAVREDLFNKAIAAGVDKGSADATSRLAAAAFRNFGRAIGVRADEAYAKLARVNILRGEAAPDMELAKAAQLGQSPVESPSLDILRKAYEARPQDQQLREFFTDPSGALNARAFEALGGDGQVAHISVEGIKFVNDTLGHEAGDQLYRAAAQALRSAAPEVAKVGGDFAVRVKDQAELDAVLAKAREAMPQGFDLTGALGQDLKSAAMTHGELKAQLETSGQRAPRGERPLGLSHDFQASKQLSKQEVTPSSIPERLRQAFESMTPEERFRAVHVEPETGLLTSEGFQALPRKKFQASIDLNGLKAVNKAFGQEFGDLFLRKFGLLTKMIGGDAFDAAHLHGDEFAAQADDRAQLEEFASKLEDFASRLVVHSRDSATGDLHVYNGVTFGRGIGETFEQADKALNEHKAELTAQGKRGAKADAERIQRIPAGKEADAALNELRRNSDLVAGNDRGGTAGGSSKGGGQVQGEVARLAQSDGGEFRLQKKGERGFITFSPPDGSSKPRRFDVHILEGADQSTFAHETFHFLSEVFGDVATRPDAPEQIKKDYQTLLEYMGHASHEERQVNASERNALSKLETRTPEQEKRLTELTAKEERVTHAWEQYLAEGKSPSLELAPIFTRFKNWMRRIYRGVSSIGRQFQETFGEPLKLSDEVRGVFDRLLASEDEVQRAQAAVEAAQPFPALEQMTPEQRDTYEQVSAQAREAAETEVQRRIVEADRKENTKFMREERARLRGEVETELDQNQTYRTLQALQEGDEIAGQLKLDRKSVAKQFGAEFASTMPRGIFAPKDGRSADEVAGLFGWQDGESMLRALAQAQPREQVIAGEVQQRLENLYGPTLLDNPRELAQKAMEAVHSPAAARKAMLELNALRRALKAEAKDAVNPEKSANAKEKEIARKEASAQAAKDSKAKAEQAQQEAQQKQLRDELLRGDFNLEDIKKSAEQMVRQRTVAELTAGDYGLALEYQRAEARATKASLEAAAKGDLVNAIAQKERQLINQSLYSAARDLRAELEAQFDRVRKTDTEAARAALGKANPAYRDGHDAILQAIGMQEAQQGQPTPSFERFVAQATADAADIAFDVGAMRELLAKPKPWAQLNADEAQNVMDAVVNIRHIARDLNEITVGDRKMARDTLFAEMQATTSKRAPQPQRPRDAALEGKLDEGRRIAQAVSAQLMTPETLVTLLDNHESNGPMRRALLDNEAKARDTKRKLMVQFTKPIVDAFHELPKEQQKRMMEQVDITKDLPLDPELATKLGEGPVTRAYLTMIALNLGNESNKQRLLDGYRWTEDQVMATLNKHMNKADWDFVQKTWDTLENMYPLVADLHERTTGLRPSKIEATPVKTPFGEYKGGYFPAREEPRAETGNVHQTPQVVADMFGESYRRPTVSRGHTKERVDKADYYVNLNWSVVPAHISQVVHDLAYREYIQQSAQILLDPRFRNLADTYLGAERAKQFVPWLQSVANAQADGVPAHVAGANRALSYVRGLAARTALSGNLASLAFHITDPWLGAAGRVTTAKDTAMAFAKAFSPMWGSMREFALENSPELQARNDHLTAELTRELAEIGKKQRGLAARAAETLGVLHHKMDAFVTTQTWTAKYSELLREGLRSGMSEDEAHTQAARAADAAVRKVYQSSEVAQQASAIRRKDFLGVALMFNGFANKMLNLQFQAADRAIQRWKGVDSGLADKVSATAGFAGTLLAMGLVGASGRFMAGKGKQEDEDYEQWFARTLLAEPFSNVPILDKVTDQAADFVITGKHKELDIRNSPVASFAEELTKKVYRAASSDNLSDQEKLEQYLETLSGFAVGGTGAAQLQRSLGYARQLYTGEAQPRGPFDVAGGLIYGQRNNQPSNPFTAAQDAISQ